MQETMENSAETGFWRGVYMEQGLLQLGGVLIMRLVVFEGYGKRGAPLLQVSIEGFLHSGLLRVEG